MKAIGKTAVAAVVLGLVASTAALANDVASLRRLDIEKQIEADFVATIRVGDDLRPHSISVLHVQGAKRHVAMTIIDQRQLQRSPTMGLVTPKPFRGSKDIERMLDLHPVVRYEGVVDCDTAKTTWTGIGFSDGMTVPSSDFRPFQRKPSTRSLPEMLNEFQRQTLCALKPWHG